MNYFLFNLVIAIFFVLFLFRLLNSYLTIEAVNNEVIEYFAGKKYAHIEVHKLTTTEKLKYGVPPIWFIEQFYKLEKPLLKLEYINSFKVEYIDAKENEWTKYVEITFKKKKIISYSEFDSFEI